MEERGPRADGIGTQRRTTEPRLRPRSFLASCAVLTLLALLPGCDGPTRLIRFAICPIMVVAGLAAGVYAIMLATGKA